VDEENKKLKLQKQQDMENGQLDGQMVRALGTEGAMGDDDSPPPCIPSMDLFVKKGEEQQDAAMDGSSFGGDFGGFGESNGFSLGSDSTSKAQPLAYDGQVSVLTHFISKASPADILLRLQAALGAVNAEVVVKNNEFRIKAIVNTMTGPITLVGQVFKHPEQSDSYIVEFHRRKGDSTQYRQIYAEIRNRCDDIAVQA